MYKIQENLQKKGFWNVDKLSEKNVFLGSCLNVVVDENGYMKDRTRLDESQITILELAKSARSLLVSGHLGRSTERDLKSSFKNNIFPSLSESMKAEGFEVILVENLEELPAAENRKEKTIYLLDNIRFFPGEDEKDKEKRNAFGKVLSETSDIFVNDAFADYRPSASTYEIAKFLPSYFGRSMLKEIESLGKFNSPERPFVAVFGGAKLSEKLDVLNTLGELADKIIVGGAMAYTLMKAKGISIGKSRVEEDKIDVAKEIIAKYDAKLVLPVDHLIAVAFGEEYNATITTDEQIPDGQIAIDIGPRTIEKYIEVISEAKSVLWNGPMGVFEWEHSSVGTNSIGKAIADNTDAYRLAGGGDSISAINKFSIEGFDHISTGGGAMLAFLAYDKFETIDVVMN